MILLSFSSAELYMAYTGGLLYPRVIRFKTYRGYGKPRIILNAIYNVIQRGIHVTCINTVKFNP